MSGVNNLIFQQSPSVEYGGNYFLNVPIILQYDDTPLLEVIKIQQAGYTTQFRIYNRDGIYIAKVEGSRLHLTKNGNKSNIKLRHPDHMTVCELDGKTLFEIRRKDAAALKTEAELFTPDGCFLKSNSNGLPDEIIRVDKSLIQIDRKSVVEGKIFDDGGRGIN